MTKNDITSREDVRKLVDGFYAKVKSDSLLAPVFSHVNWEQHLPIIYDFWSFILLGGTNYRNNPIQKHFSLPIQAEHFNRWLHLFNMTVDELFLGDKAEEAKSRAYGIAVVIQAKMGLVK